MDLTGIALAVIAAVGLVFVLFKRKKDPVIPPSIPNPSPPLTPIQNLSPVVFPPFLVGELDYGGQFTIDMRHRVHGCDAGGAPTDETGAYDPDGDLLKYWFEVTGPAKEAIGLGSVGAAENYSVFDRNGKKIDKQWLPVNHFPVVRKNRTDPTDLEMEQEAVVYCYVGRSENRPPGGVFILSACPPPVIVDPPTAPTNLGVMTVLVKVSDPSGRMRSASVREMVTITSC